MKQLFVVFLHKIGMCMIPFDRKAYVNNVFVTNDISNVETDPVAIQLKSLNIRMAVDNAENSYNLLFSNRRMMLIAVLSIVASVATVVAGCISSVVSPYDSESSTAEIAEAIRSLNDVENR